MSTAPFQRTIVSAISGLAPFGAALREFEAGNDATLSIPGLARAPLIATLFARYPTPLLVITESELHADKMHRQLASYLVADELAYVPNVVYSSREAEPSPARVTRQRARAFTMMDSGKPCVVVTSIQALMPETAPEAAPETATPSAPSAVMGATARAPAVTALASTVLVSTAPAVPAAVRAAYEPLYLQVGEQHSPHDLAARLVEMGYVRAKIADEEGLFALHGDTMHIHPALGDAPVRIEFFDDEIEAIKRFAPGSGQVLGADTSATIYPFAEPALASDIIFDFDAHARLTLRALQHTPDPRTKIAAKRPDIASTDAKLVQHARALTNAKYQVIIALPTRRLREKTIDLLVFEHVPVGLGSGKVRVVDGDLGNGYIITDAKLAVITTAEAYPRFSSTGAERRVIDLEKVKFSFKEGDYVVHRTYGVALFKQFTKREVDGIERDCFQLEYAEGDTLYTPVDQMDKLSKYVGSEAGAPKLTRLGTKSWLRATEKARASAEKLAFDLIDLYARRAQVQGFEYELDTSAQVQMEALFPYNETPDQSAAIEDVKHDMESAKPMDRLIAGDVGYGKTEVAIRAAFKAVQNGKQVMVLCPTTILAQQHFTSFSDRFAQFGVNVEVMSRFRTAKQQRLALEGFAAGTVDVLIGTHRLLSKDVVPKDLGLLVIDEEQRFGVGHKEQLKNMRTVIDVLSMSATPIPRTLQMALSGVRDMSVIDTPPENRHPIQVQVGPWDEKVVAAAIATELGRSGQVYYASNRVHSIDDARKRVTSAAPEARIGIAHGKMKADELEAVMEEFNAGNIDILVATTIIESGIDNPRSNTLIIEDSQRLGLAQLYQLKGRVGRSHLHAYAYFLYPADAPLTEEATERLLAIAEHDDLGSGLKIAMRDLEIRGAGSLLGQEQSGQISAVGFELFVTLIAEAVEVLQ